MKKSLLRAAITTALTLTFAVPAFANPFADVPANHWAYDAVNKLAQAGIVEGYQDGSFQGGKTVTRYEMAQMISKAMGKTMNADQKATVDQLSQEYAAELEAMGIKVDGVQKQLNDQVKVSGDARVRYFNTEDSRDTTEYRARVSFDGKINDNLKFNARLSSGNANADNGAANAIVDTANVSLKALGLDNTIGRQDIKLGSGFIIDTQMNGLASKIGGLKVFAGNANKGGVNRIYGAEYGMDILGAKVTADYMKDNNTDAEYYGANTSFKLIEGVTANAEFIKNDTADADAFAYGVKLNKLGLSATYRDVEAGALSAYSTLNTTDFYSVMSADGFKGMEYQYDRSLGKNTNMSVKYQDFENQSGTKLSARTSAVVNVKF